MFFVVIESVLQAAALPPLKGTVLEYFELKSKREAETKEPSKKTDSSSPPRKTACPAVRNSHAVPSEHLCKRTVDPYAVWVSEVMLQQTRVETVIGTHKRCLRGEPCWCDDFHRLLYAVDGDVLNCASSCEGH